MAVYLGEDKVNVSINSEPEFTRWEPPTDWPDFKQIYADNKISSYKNQILFLYDVTYEDSFLFLNKTITNIERILTNDGTVYTNLSTNTTHVFTTKIHGRDTGSTRKYAWAMCYGTSSSTFLSHLTQETSKYGNVLVYGEEGSYYSTKRANSGNGYSTNIGAIIVDKAYVMRQWAYNITGLQCFRCNTVVFYLNVTASAQGYWTLYNTSEFSPQEISYKHMQYDNNSYRPGAMWRLFQYWYKAMPDTIDSAQCTNFTQAFQYQYYITHIPTINMSSCTTAPSAFQACYKIKRPPEGFDTSNCTNVSYMFGSCISLKEIPNINLSKATNCTYLFYGCRSLTTLPSELNLSACTNAASMFNGCSNLEKAPKFTNTSRITNAQGMFNQCAKLREIPGPFDSSACTNTQQMFAYCCSLEKLPSGMDFSKVTIAGEMFNRCNSLTELPDNMNLSSLSANPANMFLQCTSLTNVPTHFVGPNKSFNSSFSFTNSGRVSPDSVATFDSSGNVNGGMAYYINDVTNASYTRTISLNTSIKNNFTTEQRTAVAAAFTSKGWTLSW